MEVKINKEIRDYTEAIFFGLSLRQFIFSGLACGIAVGLYFLLHPYMSMETVSWICVLGAAPCVVFGFVKYHGMTAEFPIVKDTTPNMMNPRLYTTSYNKPQGQQFDDTAVLSFIKLQYT